MSCYKTAHLLQIDACGFGDIPSGMQTIQEQGTAAGAGGGAAVGAALGQVIGGDTESTLLGAGIGAAVGGLAGNQIGKYMDRQEQDLRNAVAATNMCHHVVI